MPLKLGDNTSLIKQIKFNNSFANISDADVKLLKYGDSPVWARAYSVSLYNANTTAVDPETIKLNVSETHSYTGTSARNVIDGNVVVSDLDEANKKIYYNDSITITASAKKGYTAPSVENISSVSSDISLNSQITAGSLMELSEPELNNTPTYDVWYTTNATTVNVKNPNSVAVSVKYFVASTSSGSGTFTNAITTLGANSSDTFSIPASEIKPGSSSPNKYLTIKFIYGAASVTKQFTISKTDSTPACRFSPRSISVARFSSTNVTFYGQYVAYGYTPVFSGAAISGDYVTASANTVQPGANNFTVTITGQNVTSDDVTLTLKIMDGSKTMEWADLSIDVTGSSTGNGGGSSGGCLIGDSKIRTKNGHKNIENLKSGDIVSGIDKFGNIYDTTILNTYYAFSNYTYRIVFDNNSDITVTGNHPILCNNHYANVEGIDGYDKLNIGDAVSTINGYKKVVEIIKNDKREKVYNIYTECDNFIANDIIVACENPDNIIMGVNCFETPEGYRVKDTGLPGIDHGVIIINDPGTGGGGGGGCVGAETKLLSINDKLLLAKDVHAGDMVACVDTNKKISYSKVLNKYYADINYVYKIYLSDGSSIIVSGNHPILCNNTYYANVEGIDGYEKLNVGDHVSSIVSNNVYITNISLINKKQRVYNIYTGYDNFIANDIIVACENPDNIIMGVNCFETPEGMAKTTPGISGGTSVLS